MSDKNFETENLYTGLRGKLLLWLRAYLDDSNSYTFLRKTGAAREAGYSEKSCGSIGWQNYKKLQNRISVWMDDEGLSEVRLKTKLVKLIYAKRVVFTKVKGKVDFSSLPKGAFIVAESAKRALADKGEDAEAFDIGDTVVAIPVEDLEIQRRALDMALKAIGLYKPVEASVTVKEHIDDEDRDMLRDIAKELGRRALKDGVRGAGRCIDDYGQNRSA